MKKLILPLCLTAVLCAAGTALAFDRATTNAAKACHDYIWEVPEFKEMQAESRKAFLKEAVDRNLRQADGASARLAIELGLHAPRHDRGFRRPNARGGPRRPPPDGRGRRHDRTIAAGPGPLRGPRRRGASTRRHARDAAKPDRGGQGRRRQDRVLARFGFHPDATPTASDRHHLKT